MIKRIAILTVALVCAVAGAQVYLDQLNVDNVRIDANTISTTNTNGHLVIAPNGTGLLEYTPGTASRVLTLDSNKRLSSSSVTDTTLSYLDIGSSLTTLLAAKAPLASPTFTGTVTGTFSGNLTGNVTGNVSGSSGSTTGNAATATALAANPSDCGADTYATKIAASGNLTCATVRSAGLAGSIDATKIADGSVTSTEFQYINTLSSNAQTQLDAKQERSALTTKGDLYVATASATVARQGVGIDGQVLTADSAQTNGLKWADAPSAPTAYYVKAKLTTTAATSLGVSAILTDTEVAASDMTMTPYSGSAAAGTMCSSTNSATSPSTSATTCAAGNEVYGGSFTIPTVGHYEVCLDFSWRTQTDGGEALDNVFFLGETATNSTTILAEGVRLDVYSQAPDSTANMYIDHGIRLCSIFNWASTGTKGVRLFVQQFIAGTPDVSQILAEEGFASRNAVFSVKRLN